MSNLKKHAEFELEKIGYTKDSKDIDFSMRECVLELIDVFSKQGHSGFSASECISLFKTLSSYRILSPLTGNDDEWVEHNMGNIMYQNIRDSRVFKDKKDCDPYFIDAIVWVEPNGCTYTNYKSKRSFKFPFTPKTFYVNVSEEDAVGNRTILGVKELEEANKYYE